MVLGNTKFGGSQKLKRENAVARKRYLKKIGKLPKKLDKPIYKMSGSELNDYENKLFRITMKLKGVSGY